MAEERGFYAISGEYISREGLVQKMIDSFNDKYPKPKITDFNEGSVIRNILESIGTDIFHMELNDESLIQLAFLTTMFGSYLDLKGEELQTPRILGSSSIGNVTFSIPEAQTIEITIPSGTVLVDSETGYYFNTTAETRINIGDTSCSVSAVSQVTGEAANSRAGKITVFRDNKPSELLSVTNNAAFTGGTDYEEDEAYRERLLAKQGEDSFGSREYYIRLGESVDGVHDVLLTDATGYTGKVLVNGDEKPLDDDILALVVAQYIEPNLVYKQTFLVEECDYTEVDLEITAGVYEEVDDQLFIDVLETLFNGGLYVSESTSQNLNLNYPGLRINEPLTVYQLLTALEAPSFVSQITNITSDSETFNKLTPDENECLKLGTVSITQNVIN
ncbi:baseplate J/gp47 family protein [uncultured Methanobrevibacter sp.]|uniref:baseplate J/gp47 family protein n=1 Tax=uncultured Methanobrevibacter sp. TaxID=253161 RepID=UPI0025E1FF25|nr:baseplate J/gp47 family protein [uncultured Methanobrevibacter sp.]